MTIATLDECRAYLTVNGTGDDVLLKRLLAAAESFIYNYVDRPLASPAASFSARVDGNGHDYLVLWHYPIVSITSVVVDGFAVPATSLTFGSADTNDSRIVYLANQVFARGRRNVLVSGTFGWAAWPEDLKQAQLELCGVRYKERSRLGEVSKQVGGETVSYSESDLLKPTKAVLQSYQNKAPL